MLNNIIKRGGNFTALSNNFLRDKNISFKAKGLFAYMYSMSKNWNFTISSIAKQQKDGQASIISAMDELKKFGYMEYIKNKDGTGTYILNEVANVENPNVGNPKLGKPNGIKKEQFNKKKNNNIYTELEKKPIEKKTSNSILTTKEKKELSEPLEDFGEEKLIEEKLTALERLTIDEVKSDYNILVLAKEKNINLEEYLEDFRSYYLSRGLEGNIKKPLIELARWLRKHKVNTNIPLANKNENISKFEPLFDVFIQVWESNWGKIVDLERCKNAFYSISEPLRDSEKLVNEIVAEYYEREYKKGEYAKNVYNYLKGYDEAIRKERDE